MYTNCKYAKVNPNIRKKHTKHTTPKEKIKLSVKELKIHSKTTQLRKAIHREMTIDQLAERVGLSPGTIKRYLDSEYNSIPAATREAIENALSTKPVYLTETDQVEHILNTVDHELQHYYGDLTFFNNLIKFASDHGTAAQVTRAEILSAANTANSSMDMAIQMLADLSVRTKHDPFLKVTVMKELAYTYYLAKYLDECDEVLKKAIRLSMDNNLGDHMLGKLHHMSGLSKHKSERYEAAEKSFRIAEKYYTEDRPIEQCRMRILIGLCQVKTDKRKANRTLVAALKTAIELNNDELLTRVYNNLFECNIENSGFAELYAKKAVEHAHKTEFPISIAVSRYNLVRYHLKYEPDPTYIEKTLSDPWAFENLTLAHLEEALKYLIEDLSGHADGDRYLELMEGTIFKLLTKAESISEQRKYKEIYGHIYFNFIAMKG